MSELNDNSELYVCDSFAFWIGEKVCSHEPYSMFI